MDLIDADRSQAVLGNQDQTEPGHGGLEAGGPRPGAGPLEMICHGFQVDVVVAGLGAAAGDGGAVGGGQGAVGATLGTCQVQGAGQDVPHRCAPQEGGVLRIVEGGVGPGGAPGGDHLRPALVQVPESHGQSPASRGGRPPGGTQREQQPGPRRLRVGSPDESGVGWAGDGCERLSQGPGGGQGAEDGGLVDGIVALGERSEPPCGGGQQSGQAGQLLQAGDLGQALQVGGAAGAGV